MKWFVSLLGVFAFVSSVAAAEIGLEEVHSLGQLNGQALACSQKENISRIKAVMISHAPKSRLYGATFEQSTEEAFLQRSTEPEACDDAPVIALKVDLLATRLQQLFPPRATQ